jgi:hypothetical protein
LRSPESQGDPTDCELDRLGRNVAFIANLMVDAAVAEDEARRISERTKAALQAAKARVRKRMRWADEHSLNDGLRNGKTGGRLNT